MTRAAALLLLSLAAACGGGERRAASHAVEIRAFRFAPDTLAVSPGDTVVWTNHDVVPHTATSAGGGWDTGEIAGGASGRIVVPERRGTHPYVCAFHPTMKGVLVVR